MNATTFNSTHIVDALETIDVLGLDKAQFIEELENLDTNGACVIINDEAAIHTEIKLEEIPNTLRVFNTPVYVSVAQIIENIKGDFFGTIIKLIPTISEDATVATAIAKALLPHIAVSVHLITNAEWCVYTTAVEFFVRDNKKYHHETDFAPKFIGDPYCDNLVVPCQYRRKDMCKTTKVNILKALNSLEGKHILERNEVNEYRYVRW